jgi:DNA mismatch repair protein MutL
VSSEPPVSRIHVLDEAVANQIAAGEVIERPSSVVKELAENAVDAGGTRIQVELGDGGRQLIRVTDNGEGMTAQEAVIALQRHATSKIATADDLLAVRTLGFRGEALPSIASVSRMTVVTRRRGELEGTHLEAAGGEIVSLEPAGAPEGTTITIADLFYNTPARLKFLKSGRTELGQACDALVRIALARSDVSVTLQHEGSELLASPGGDLLNAITALYGKELARGMLAVEWSRAGVRVCGFVAAPTATRPTRSAQSFFVNGRFVRSRTLTHALDEAYRGTLPTGRFAAAVLRLELDPGLVDVNVHPTKAEVRFLRDWEIHRAVHEAVKTALGFPAVHASAAPAIRQTLLTPEQLASGDWLAGPGGAGGATAPGEPASEARPWIRATGGAAADLLPGQLQIPEAVLPGELRPIAQLWNSYILVEAPAGLLIIDQHLAHERVLFQKLTERREAGGGVQRLAIPQTLQVTRRHALAVDEALPELEALGFELEPFGRDAFVVRAVPACLAGGEELAALRAIIDEMGEEAGARRPAVPRDRAAATAACKAAVKKGMRLAPAEIRQLVDDLTQTAQSHTCPHGCPIAVELGYQELLKRFRRS